MEQLKSIIPYIKSLFFASFFFSCEDDKSFNLECIQCFEYSYLQTIDEFTYINLTLNDGVYCVGDSAWQTESGYYWTAIDDELILALFQSEHCDTIGP